MAIIKAAAPDNQIFYDWEDMADQWVVNENDFDLDFPSLPQDLGTSLAAHVVENIFELELSSDSDGIGGYLPGYDVKNRDAYQIIQLSLATELADEKLYECYVDEEGMIKFYLIGENISDIGTDVLYDIATAQMKQKCDNVVITGYDPPAKRIVRGPYPLFTFAQEHVRDNDVGNNQSIYYDPDMGSYPKYWVLGDELGAEACKMYKQGYIEFGKPWLNDEGKLSSNGAGVNYPYVYDHKAFEKIMGWIYKIEIPFYEQGSTQIELQNKCPRYITLDSFGELQQRSWIDNIYYKPQMCLTGQEIDFTKGVYLPDSESRKFLGVREVYIYGYELKSIYPDEYYDDTIEEMVPGLTDFVVDLETRMKEPIRLSSGQDYIVAKDPDDSAGRYKIIFSCNVSPNWIEKFGGDITNSTNDFRISRSSIYKKTDDGELTNPDCDAAEEDNFWGITHCAGYLRDGQTQADNDTRYWASIFPMGEGTSGYALESDAKIVIVYDWDNPCVSILDNRQSNEVTVDNLKNVKIELYAIISKDLPPPIAYCNGGSTTMLDPRQQIPDLDFSTVENLTGCDYQKALEGLENGDVKIVLPFLGCEGNPWDSCSLLENASKFIYELQNDIVESVTYVCKPDAAPVLGEVIDGKTINSINYSYQDSSQYLISVQAGPRWQGVGGWDSSVYQNKVERVQVEGVIRHVYPDNMKCLVQLERIGLLECVNGQIDPLEIGDTVKVTVYNNPISV
jgi:hypothetical protein